MRLFLFSILLLSVLPLMATEQAFPPTAPGVAEFKTLPAGVLLKSTGRGSYFDESNRLFRPLFNYISSQKIAMTTPVEAQIDQAVMYFWVAPSEVAKVVGDRDGVEDIRISERQVASLGARGGYGRDNFEQTRDKLRAWLETHPEVEVTGEAYAVYWHGPFTPWFAKRSEVHIPVRTKPTTP
jgi:hypothetical protein